LEKAEAVAERLRKEPYRLLTNDCVLKAQKLKKECRQLGISTRTVICLGLGEAKLFGRWMTIPVIHGWAEVAGKRVEVSRPLGSAGVWGIVPVNIRPLVTIRI
jgi:hypothetical protein